jgi:hypothetical protein
MRFTLFSLLLGVIVNVAVAWGIAQFAPRHLGLDGARVMTVLKMRVNPGGSSGYAKHESWSQRSFGSTIEADVRDNGSLYIADDEHIIATLRVGWPCRCLSTRAEELNGVWSEHGLSVPLVMRHDLALWPELPLCPVWPGFLVNTVLYALLLFPLVQIPSGMRRHIRRKRGRCPKCGYDLRGQPPETGPAAGAGCPECGWNRQPEATA